MYALYNTDHNKIYVGETSNIDRRLLEHNEKRGKHFTARFSGEWQLIYKEDTIDRKQALVREKQLKSFKGREFIKQYIPL